MPEKVKTEYDILDERTLLYGIKDKLNISMIDFGHYIEEEYPIIECDNIKKNYIYLTTDNYDVKKCLSKFILEQIEYNSLDDNFDRYDDEELLSLIYNNIDIFADITEKADVTYIIEINE